MSKIYRVEVASRVVFNIEAEDETEAGMLAMVAFDEGILGCSDEDLEVFGGQKIVGVDVMGEVNPADGAGFLAGLE